MAQNNQSLSYICRCCRQHLQKPNLVTRSFSTTPQRKRTIPNFTPTSNTELDTLLSTWRSKVFTPAALTTEHRHLIYRPRRQSILLNDPGVTVTLSDGEEVKLTPMKEWQRPRKHDSLGQLSTILGNTDDPVAWNNLPAFLEGMNKAHLKIDDWFFQKIVRKANMQGQSYVVVRCAEMVERTRFSLSTPEVAIQLMLGCHDRAVQEGFKGEEFEKILKQAEHITLLLEKKEHCGGKLGPGKVDARRSLGIVGVLLELSAAKAVHTDGGKDIDGRVASFVNKALAMSQDGFETDVSESNLPTAIVRRKNLEQLLPLWHGMKLAMKVEGVNQTELKKRFAKLDQTVKRDVEEVREESGETPRRPVLMYDALKNME